MPVVPAIIIIYILAVCVVFFSFFTAKIAQMKLRSTAWGAVGAVLGPIGMVIVSYLPSRRKDGKETNFVRSAIKALPNFSRKAFVFLVGLLSIVSLIVYLIGAIPKWKENREYEKSIGTAVTDRLQYMGSVPGPISDIAAGKDSTYLINEKGELYTWGYNDLALSLEDKGAAADNVKGVAQMDRTVYLLKKDGKLYTVDADGKTQKIGDNVKKVVCSNTFGAYLKQTGDVYVWGSNADGQLGTSTDAYLDTPRWLCGAAKDVACGGRHLLILKEDGTVIGSGSNVTGALNKPDQNGTVSLKLVASQCKAIACGTDFSLVLTNDNILKSCGDNSCGQLGREVVENNGLSLEQVKNGVTDIGAGGRFGWYIVDGALYTWGENLCGQLGIGNSAAFSSIPSKVMADVTAVAASYDHLVILSNNKVYACGDNTYGQLGRLGESHSAPSSLVTVKK